MAKRTGLPYAAIITEIFPCRDVLPSPRGIAD